MKVLGPFETTWNYQFLLITDNSLSIIKADFWLTMKYAINLQYELFPNAVEKAKKRILANNKSSQNFREYNNIKEVILYERKHLKNYLKVTFADRDFKLYILERSETDLYKNTMKLYLGGKFKIAN